MQRVKKKGKKSKNNLLRRGNEGRDVNVAQKKKGSLRQGPALEMQMCVAFLIMRNGVSECV